VEIKKGKGEHCVGFNTDTVFAFQPKICLQKWYAERLILLFKIQVFDQKYSLFWHCSHTNIPDIDNKTAG
jgi:hypothetical protein